MGWSGLAAFFEHVEMGQQVFLHALEIALYVLLGMAVLQLCN
jgi:hypothetical protein